MKKDKRIIFLLLCSMVSSISSAVFSQEEKRLSFVAIKKARVFYEKADSLKKAGLFLEAAANYSKTFQLIPSNKQAGFEAAKSFCLAGEKDSAMKYVRKTIQAGGLFDYEHEPSLKPIRSEDSFIEMMEVYKLLKKELENKYIQPLVVFPEKFEKTHSHPLIVALHGFSDHPQSMVDALKESADQYNGILISCRGSVVIGQNAYAWNQSQQEYERIFDDIQHALRNYPVDKSKVILAGYWQGGLMAYGLGISFSGLFRGILLIDSNVPDNLLVEKMDKPGLRIFHILRSDDNEQMIAQNENFRKRFTANGGAYKLDVIEGRAHHLPDEIKPEIAKGLDWILNQNTDN